MSAKITHMKVIVTGGAGFIGSHVVEALLNKGFEVAVIDDFNDFYDPAEKHQNIEGFRGNIKLFEGNICDSGFLNSTFKEFHPNKVIHLAARAGVRPSILNPLLYSQVNIDGTVNILEACIENNMKQIVFASSSSIYGDNKTVPFSEVDPVNNPISPYAATKRAGELMAYTFHHLHGLPVTCLRLFTVYGPRQRPDLAIRSFMEKIESGQEISIFGDGSMKRDFTYVDDIVQGILAALEKPLGYEIINLGNESPVSVSEMVSAIEKVLGKKANISFEPEKPGDVQITYANIAKAKELLGYAPQTKFEDGLTKMANWLRERP